MNCTACGNDNQAGAKFCVHCGVVLGQASAHPSATQASTIVRAASAFEQAFNVQRSSGQTPSTPGSVANSAAASATPVRPPAPALPPDTPEPGGPAETSPLPASEIMVQNTNKSGPIVAVAAI